MRFYSACTPTFQPFLSLFEELSPKSANMEATPPQLDDTKETGKRSRDNCVICLNSLGEDYAQLYHKGLTTLTEASRLCGDIDLNVYLTNVSVGDALLFTITVVRNTKINVLVMKNVVMKYACSDMPLKS